MSSSFVLDNTFGVAFIGVVITATLHGVSIVQAWYYYGHQSDNWALKSLVAAVMTFNTIHQALITHAVYSYTITNWGDPGALEKIVWSSTIEVLFNGLIALLVQSFMTIRVWRFSNGKIWLTGLIAMLVLAEFVCSLTFTILETRMDTFAQLVQLTPLSITINALAAVVDVLIAGTLCTLLHLSRTGYHRSDTMINKLILFTVNTGLLTSFFAIASLISLLVAGDTFFYVVFFICMGRLYTNSLLATLNARQMILKAAEGISNSTGLLNVSLPKFSKHGDKASRRATNISINVQTTKASVIEDMDKTDVCSRDAHTSESGQLEVADVSYFQASCSNVQVYEDKNKRQSFLDA